jgi:hypothetical protein
MWQIYGTGAKREKGKETTYNIKYNYYKFKRDKAAVICHPVQLGMVPV